ncbi:hypothetical protein [Pseudoalteromonas sp.]|uniref:hypothetical protein n=1 Tax=Pseudoalteromonas sp. TaxID=53249 RepID=UPI003567B10B
MKHIHIIIDKKADPRSYKKRSMTEQLDSHLLTENIDLLFSCRKIQGIQRGSKIGPINACGRFDAIKQFDVRRGAFYKISLDCMFYELLLWDFVHELAVGGSFLIIEDDEAINYLQSNYFSDCFEVTANGNVVEFKKLRALPVESDKGLSQWSFGIPTGPGDATILNHVVERILSFDCEKEIILCGRPGNNFKYLDEVSIVGEDIAAPPVQISKKKNVIVENAKFSNVAILHDRVLLPADFIDKMKLFGDLYPFTTMQSLYFKDYFNRRFVRYSDVGTIDSSGVLTFSKEQELNQTAFNEATFSSIEKYSKFYFPNPACYEPSKTYPTGSLYIFKKSIWKFAKLDENLRWAEFEDVEHGLRMYREGIPCKVNPHSFTQSILSRPLLYCSGEQYKSAKLKPTMRKPSDSLILKQKPLLKITVSAALKGYKIFEEKYCVESKIGFQDIPNSPYKRYALSKNLLNHIECAKTDENIKALIKDYEKYILCDQLSYSNIELYHQRLGKLEPINYQYLGTDGQFIQQFLCSTRKHFADDLSDFFSRNGLAIRFFSLISAIKLKYMSYKLVYLNQGVLDIYKTILNTTPWKKI